jgi:hypothetical protein
VLQAVSAGDSMLSLLWPWYWSLPSWASGPIPTLTFHKSRVLNSYTGL